MKIDENIYDDLEKVSKITGVEYDIKWFNAENIDGYIEQDDLFAMLQDLLCEYDRLKEEMEDQENYYKSNWKPIAPSEMYGIGE